MDLPALRHFTPERISSDPVEALVGEAWVPAIYTDKGWATADGVSMLLNVEDWRYAVEKGRIQADNCGQHQNRDEVWQTTKASRGNRAVKGRQNPQT